MPYDRMLKSVTLEQDAANPETPLYRITVQSSDGDRTREMDAFHRGSEPTKEMVAEAFAILEASMDAEPIYQPAESESIDLDGLMPTEAEIQAAKDIL